MRHAFYGSNVIAVSGESVVAGDGNDVKKFMFRYPGTMSTDVFQERVTEEVGCVTRCLAGIALPTEVGIMPATVLRSQRPPRTVVQTQRMLDLEKCPAFKLQLLEEKDQSVRSQAARQISALLEGADRLLPQGFYPDISVNSDNLRMARDGSLALIDVMPVYTDGTRLIGDRPPRIVERISEALDTYRRFEGKFGS